MRSVRRGVSCGVERGVSRSVDGRIVQVWWRVLRPVGPCVRCVSWESAIDRGRPRPGSRVLVGREGVGGAAGRKEQRSGGETNET